MKLSLIIPIYNQAENLDIIIASLYNQIGIEKEDYEVIIVDDGSCSGISDLSTTHRDLNIIYLRHSENLGRAATRNTGAKIANGEIVVFSDGDRFLSPVFLSKHYKFHKNHKESLLIGGIVEIFVKEIATYLDNISSMFLDSSNKMWKFARIYNYAEQVLKIYDENGHTDFAAPWVTLFSGNFSIRQSDYNLVGGFDECYEGWGYENIDFGYRLHSAGINYFYDNEATNFHIYHMQKRLEGGKEEITMLSQKYYDCLEIKQFIKFLNGEISLNGITEVEGKSVDATLDSIYYLKNKLGSKYKPTIYGNTNNIMKQQEEVR